MRSSDGGTTSMIGDFDWTWRGVRVRKTGAWVPFDGAHLSEVAHWLIYFCAVMLSPRHKSGPRIRFLPDPARPWYLVWPVLRLAGGKPVPPDRAADVTMHFSDETIATPVKGHGDGVWNNRATDISKSRVAAVFEAVFGYGLSIDPTVGAGCAVEKGEANGVHDGRIVTLPCAAQPGKVYQKLIDARADDGLVEDLRTPTVGGKPICVFIKRRPIEARFSNDNVACPLKSLDQVFSQTEVDLIGQFCAAMGLDWGGLDILRDRTDGRIYIVDVNRTDMGPPIAMPLRQKLAATRLLADALRHTIQERTEAPSWA